MRSCIVPVLLGQFCTREHIKELLEIDHSLDLTKLALSCSIVSVCRVAP